MKKLFYLLNCVGILVTLLAFPGYRAAAFEPQAVVLPDVELITPGMIRTINITQENRFPLVNRLLIVGLGYGGIRITMQPDSENTQEGDFLIMTGMGISSAGIVPIIKFGEVNVTLTAEVGIGTAQYPFGIIWLSSGVHSTTNDPPYVYQLVLRASLGFNNEL